MVQESVKNFEVYLGEPRLKMTVPGRILVRVVSYVAYLVLIASSATAIFISYPDISDPGIRQLHFLGGFLALFLLDRLIHLREADKPLSELPKKGTVRLSQYLRPRAFSALEKAYDRSALGRRNFFLETMKQLLNFSEIEEGLKRLDLKPNELKQKTEELLSRSVETGGNISAEDRYKQAEVLAAGALNHAIYSGHRFIELSDLFSGLRQVGDESIGRIFSTFDIDPDDLETALIFGSVGRGSALGKIPGMLGGFVLGSHTKIRHRVMNRAWTSRPTPTLDRYSLDFTDLARQGQVGFLIGHREEFGRLLETLARPINPNVLLIGEVGIGKETLLQHLALKLSKDEVPEALFDKRLVSLGLENLAAGAAPEELGARIKKIVDEILVAGNVILYIPDIHNLVRTSGTAYLSAADILMPIIMNNAFPIVGSTYPREHKQLIEPRSDFAGLFEAIRVNEITETEAQKVLTYDCLILERKFGVTISFGAVKKSVLLAKKYIRNKFLPTSAEELLKSAIVEAKRRGEKFVGPDTVIAVAEEKINIPMHEATEAEAQKLLNLEAIIHERLIDQEEAVKAVADALREYRSGLARPGGPIASFLFVGPTGVGKTELAKTLARVQFDSEKAMVRFDMTEYQDKQSFYRFIGSPDGGVSGALTDAILQKPYSLVLLDEFEKAFPDILNLFLQVLDDGRLTDNLGRTVDFTNTIIIATSNAHSDIINEALNHGQSMKDIAEYLKKKLTDVFKPELLNRFSRVVVFKNLEPADLEKVVALNLKDLAALVGGQGIRLSFDPAVVKKLVQLGYDPAFGARPLRRVIDEKLRSPLASAILDKKVTKGSSVKLVLRGDEFDFVPAD